MFFDLGLRVVRMTSSLTKLTYQDYLLLPDDGNRYEVMEGDLYMTPAPLTRHQIIVGRIHHLLMSHLEKEESGTVLMAPCDVLLSEIDVMQPDLVVVLPGGLATITAKHIQGPPDVVIEVLSPSTAKRDRELKRKRYEHFGVREYWLVDPSASCLEILQLQHGQYTNMGSVTSPNQCSTDLLPGLIIDLSWIFHQHRF